MITYVVNPQASASSPVPPPPKVGRGNSHRKVYGGVESQTTLVRSQHRVELHTVAPVDLEVVVVVLPHDAELDDTLGDGSDF